MVKVDPRLWQRGAGRDHIVDVTSAQLGVNWHSAPKGAALVATYQATVHAVRTETCVVPGTRGPDIERNKVMFSRWMRGQVARPELMQFAAS